MSMTKPYLVPVAMCLAAMAHAHSPVGQAEALRPFVRQIAPSTSQADPPRQLSAQERAELRKLLSQTAKRQGKGS